MATALHNKTILVIVPFIALRADMDKRCKDVGLQASYWENARPPHICNILFATPEAAKTGNFQHDIITLVHKQHVAHVFVDEAHISNLDCPKILRTGALPPEDRLPLMNHFAIVEKFPESALDDALIFYITGKLIECGSLVKLEDSNFQILKLYNPKDKRMLLKE
ncbi:uncharacterized protein CIMG_11518 [Coccidioides immitis RS]|uniref:Helicase ATP-binding domain-containing protein n=1 Tax=Coccidioides immitis (strain RS) TaxID=246410 RepID=J3KFE0_COCIM|nr:uncharacterized protein CIMG_11518 [Coccidioides immitis RS]EAS34330.3 hypothetical protein CIMG_11518 [Coccidioides immitis RS]